MPLIKIPVTEDTDMEVPAIERGLLRLWHNDQLKLYYNEIIELGCNESMFAQTMSEHHNFVVGIDVRPYTPHPYNSDNEKVEPKFSFIQEDATEVVITGVTFDLGVAISSVEHFGLGEYGDIKDEYADARAMQNMWYAIKPKGVVMVTLPISNKGYRIDLGYIRKYDKQSLKYRIIQGNHIQRFEIITHPGGPDFVGGAKAFESFDFSDIDYKATIYLEMVKVENEQKIGFSETIR